jgi:hypothetical protein
MAQDTTVFDDGEGGGFDEGEIEVEDEGVSDGKKKGVSQRTGGYIDKEDLVLCQSLLATSQYSICRAEQTGNAYWRNVTKDFHERRLLPPFELKVTATNFQSKRGGRTSNKRLTCFAR